MTRKLATIDVVTSLKPIVGADLIELARIRGWDVIVKKEEFQPGDPVVYFEVDTMLDVDDARFQFLAIRGVKEDAEGRWGHRLKTIKMKKQISQGLALPASRFPELAGLEIGTDVTGRLPIWKWEPPVPPQLAGVAWGPLPAWIPRTDEVRIQNVASILQLRGLDWVATEKIDGSSCSMFWDGQEPRFGVCSRNLDLKEEDGNWFWSMARFLNMEERLSDWGAGRRVAVQGELCGTGIQGNELHLPGRMFLVFGMVVDGVRWPRSEWPDWVTMMAVPILRGRDARFPATVDACLAQANANHSLLNNERLSEGIVWTVRDLTEVELPDGQLVRASFKAIANGYLARGKAQ